MEYLIIKLFLVLIKKNDYHSHSWIIHKYYSNNAYRFQLTKSLLPRKNLILQRVNWYFCGTFWSRSSINGFVDYTCKRFVWHIRIKLLNINSLSGSFVVATRVFIYLNIHFLSFRAAIFKPSDRVSAHYIWWKIFSALKLHAYWW